MIPKQEHKTITYDKFEEPFSYYFLNEHQFNNFIETIHAGKSTYSF